VADFPGADVEHIGPTPVTRDHDDINEIKLPGRGDIMLLYTDGPTEH